MAGIDLSILDLCPLLSGKDATHTFRNSVDLARFTEKLGYKRIWLAEHHNMEGIGSSAPEVLIAHIASATEKIRVGSGGIMLPNHASLHMAEVFRTLEALYPGRIDLGIGRAPGSGSKAAQALRGSRGLSADIFPTQLEELMTWLEDKSPQTHPDVMAIPGGVNSPELWILGSSDFGAQLAAYKGLPYSFAQHFSHLPALEIVRLYHEGFRPSKWLKEPKVSLGVHVICADTDEEARELALSTELSFSLFVQTGRSIPLPTIEEAKAYPYSNSDWDQIRAGSMPKIVGSPELVRKKLEPFIKSGLINELMVLTMVYDHEARKKSYQLLAEILS